MDALDSLGALTRDEHRHAERRRLLLDAARVGDDDRGSPEQPRELRIPERLGQDDVVQTPQRDAELLADERVRVQRDDERHVGPLRRDGCEPGADPSQAAVPVLATVSRDDDIRPAAVEHARNRVVRERDVERRGVAESVDAGVAGDEHALVGDALAHQVLLVQHRRGEVERRDAPDQLAVQLLGERCERAPGAEAGLDMADGDAQIEGRQGGRRRRRRVAVDEHPGREPSLAYLIAARHPLAGRPEAVAAEAVEVGHHGRHELVERQTGVAHAEVVIGLDRAELEDRRHQIGVLAGRHDDRAEDRAAPERQHDGEHLDRFGTRPDQDEEIVAPLAVHDRHAPRLADQVRTLHRCA